MRRSPDSVLTSPEVEGMDVKGTFEEPLTLIMEFTACRCLYRQVPNWNKGSNSLKPAGSSIW